MTLNEPALGAFQPLFDELRVAAISEGDSIDQAAFAVAAGAFGRAPDSSGRPTQSVREMVISLGEICVLSPEGAAEAEQLGSGALLAKSAKLHLVGIYFLKRFLKEIRSIICDNKKLRNIEKVTGANPKTMVTLIVGQLPVSLLGLSNQVLALLVSLVLAMILQASRTAFCEATDDDVMTSIIDAGLFESDDKE